MPQSRVPRSRVGGDKLGVLTQTATALAALGALVFTGVSLTVTQDQNEAQNHLAAQSQYTDRYTKAVEQLGQQGTDRLQIRLGGIYALERLARDSPRDQPTIIEVLSAFVRTNNPRTANDKIPASLPPTTDAQAALTVLSRRDTSHDNGTSIDLSNSSLKNTDLGHANLGSAILGNVDLAAAYLGHANLADAYLRRANLVGTYLGDADLGDADLSDAHLGRAVLSDADLSRADLSGADLASAHLSDADLAGADLSGADLRGADLSDADLRGADLGGADLRGSTHSAGTRTDQVYVDSTTRWW